MTGPLILLGLALLCASFCSAFFMGGEEEVGITSLIASVVLALVASFWFHDEIVKEPYLIKTAVEYKVEGIKKIYIVNAEGQGPRLMLWLCDEHDSSECRTVTTKQDEFQVGDIVVQMGDDKTLRKILPQSLPAISQP